MLYKLFIKVSITGEKNMDIPKIIAEDLLKLKDLKKLVIFLLCVLVCCFGVFVYDNYVIKEQQNQIEKLEGLFERSELEKKELQNSSQNNNGFGGNMTSNLFNNNCLYQNVPNPFNELTIINYYIDNNSKSASLNLYDLNGKLIKCVPIETLGKGEITINAGELKPGVYVYTLIVDGSLVDTKQMILTK